LDYTILTKTIVYPSVLQVGESCNIDPIPAVNQVIVIDHIGNDFLLEHNNGKIMIPHNFSPGVYFLKLDKSKNFQIYRIVVI